jgi:hypothetical protein
MILLKWFRYVDFSVYINASSWACYILRHHLRGHDIDEEMARQHDLTVIIGRQEADQAIFQCQFFVLCQKMATIKHKLPKV